MGAAVQVGHRPATHIGRANKSPHWWAPAVSPAAVFLPDHNTQPSTDRLGPLVAMRPPLAVGPNGRHILIASSTFARPISSDRPRRRTAAQGLKEIRNNAGREGSLFDKRNTVHASDRGTRFAAVSTVRDGG
ncbi:hypothetical protein MRX96_011593 [Rhipicephalus microplus]